MNASIVWFSATLVLATHLDLDRTPASLSDTIGCATRSASSFVINVKDKGARGDGQTDDTSAIQAAIDEVAEKKEVRCSFPMVRTW
jgi:polygalacturonase